VFYLEASVFEMGRGIRVAQRIELLLIQFRIAVRKEDDAIQEKVESEGEYRGSLFWIQGGLGVLCSQSQTSG
jgi:hypothetical protein